MPSPSVIVLGGGLSGVAVAYTLARAGWQSVTVVERGPALGGLAGSFEKEGRFYPLGYHHILHRDSTLLYFLDLIGALASVRWRRIRMFFELAGRQHELGTPAGFLRFPMSFVDKLRFVRLMLRSFRKASWSDWEQRSAAELIDAWGGPGVRQAIFERLTQLKFQLPCNEVSGAWLGSRLYHREGSAPLGYSPNANWT
jgi:protoporphyrinogen oxidase